MVKIPKRLSQNSKGMNGVRNHFGLCFPQRRSHAGNPRRRETQWQKSRERPLRDWQKLGIPDESKHREALNIVLSMPEHTDPKAVLNATRTFAAEQFAGHLICFRFASRSP